MTHECSVPRAEALRYLGCRGGAPDSGTAALLEECAEQIQRTARPRSVWRRFAFRPGAEGIALEGSRFVLEGGDIRRHLEGCASCVLMAATLGAQADRLIAAAQVSGMARAVVLDCCATAAIEDYCDRVQGQIREEAMREGLCATSRFSPGYGDLPIGGQKGFAALLDTPRRIGMSPTSDNILVPRKSVTAVVGLGRPAARSTRGGCESCAMRESCQFRKDGERCGQSDRRPS